LPQVLRRQKTEERRDPEAIRIAYIRQCRKALRDINEIGGKIDALAELDVLAEDDATLIKSTLQPYIDELVEELRPGRVEHNAGDGLNANTGSRPPAVVANTGNTKRPQTIQLCDPPKRPEQPKAVAADTTDGVNVNTPQEGDKRVEHNTGDGGNSNKQASAEQPAPVDLNAGDGGNTNEEKSVTDSAVQNPGESADELMRESEEEEGGEDDPLVGL